MGKKKKNNCPQCERTVDLGVELVSYDGAVPVRPEKAPPGPDSQTIYGFLQNHYVTAGGGPRHIRLADLQDAGFNTTPPPGSAPWHTLIQGYRGGS